jgi:pimeloyl-ACP methyl ester carboxylesterase
MNRRGFFHLSGAAAAFATLDMTTGRMFGLSSACHCKEMTAAEFHSARKFISTNHGRISFLDIGEGPAALFLHGFPLNSFQWRGAIPQLSMIRRCIAPDFLALGYTEVVEGQSVGPQAQVAMLTQLLDKLSISDVDIVANDSGGAIAQLFMTRYPNRVKSLLLTNCDTEPDSPPRAVLPVIELGRNGKFADEWLAPWLAKKTLARSETGLGGQCYADPTHPTDEAIETYLAPLVSSPRRKTLTNAYAAGLDPNPLAGIESALKRCYVATRIVWGTGDKIFSQASPDYLARTVANSLGVRRVPGAKLFFPEEMPGLIVEEAQFLWSL